MRVFIAGGTGAIGRALAMRLQVQGYRGIETYF
jgi:nucleoside-diphosphate-sugar epimerase